MSHFVTPRMKPCMHLLWSAYNYYNIRRGKESTEDTDETYAYGVIATEAVEITAIPDDACSEDATAIALQVYTLSKY